MSAMLVACGGGQPEGENASARTGTTARALGTNEVAAVTPAAAAVASRASRSYSRRGITALSPSPDGSFIAVAGDDGMVRLLDAVTLVDSGRLRGSVGAPATGVLVLPGSMGVAGVGRDSTLRIWDGTTGRQRLQLHGHEHPLRFLASSADGRRAVTGGEETRVMLWDLGGGRLERILRGARGIVNVVAISADAQVVAAGDATGRCVVWDAATGAARQAMQAHADDVQALALDRSGRLLATASDDQRVALWDTATGERVHLFDDHKRPVRSLGFSPDGRWLAAGDDRGRVLVWDVGTRQRRHEVVSARGAAVNALAFHPRDSDRLFAAGDDHRVLLWTLSKGISQ